MFERGGQCQGIGIFIDHTEDFVRAIPAIIEFVEVGERVILFKCCFVNEDEVVDFERGKKCFGCVVFDHGVAGFDKMVTSEGKEFLSRGKKRFDSSVLRFEIRTGKVKREVGMSLVDEIEGRHTSGGVGKIVVGDFSSSKEFRPRRRVVPSVDTKILFKSTIGAFSLAISLWVISSREAKGSFGEREEFMPEVRKKAGVTIRYNATRETV